MFDLNELLNKTTSKLAEVKGYDSFTDLLAGSAAKNIARITDKANETKQTPAAVEPAPYALQMLAEQSPLGLTNGQLLLIGGAGVLAVILLLRK